MKRVISSAKKKSSILIIGLLLLANLVAFGVASHYLNNNNVQAAVPHEEHVAETGWQVLGWSYSLLEYLRFQPQG